MKWAAFEVVVAHPVPLRIRLRLVRAAWRVRGIAGYPSPWRVLWFLVFGRTQELQPGGA